MSAHRKPLDERLFSRVVKAESGCFLWTGGTNRDGYGQITVRGEGGQQRSHRVHRLIYEQIVGAIPDGLELDHLCGVRLCVHPGHLEPVTHAENQARMAKRRGRTVVFV